MFWLSIIGFSSWAAFAPLAMPADTLPQQPTAAAASAPLDSLRPLTDQAMITSRASDFDRLLAYLDRELARHPNDPVLLHYRGFALYRKASLLTATGGERTRVKAMFEEADALLQRSDAALHWPETAALRAAIVGQLIGLAGPLGAVRMGSRVSRFLDEAIAQGPNNPRVWMLRGVSNLYRPTLFGGGVGKAEADISRALALFERDAPLAPTPWWGHAEAHGWMGQVYAKQGKLEEARAEYAKALTLQPGNAWVSEFLLQALPRERR